MRILVLENEPSSQRGGQELSLLDVCRGLAQRGHEIHLVYLKEGDLLDEYRKFAKSIIGVHTYTIAPQKWIASLISWIISFLKVLPHRCDIVYANQYHDTLFGGFIALVWRRPFICHLRLIPPTPICFQFRVGLSMVRHFIANSVDVRRRYEAIGIQRRRLSVVYNGIDLDYFLPGPRDQLLGQSLGASEDSYVILYVGRIDEQKGLGLLLEAFAKLPKQTRLWIVGKPVVQKSYADGVDYLQKLHQLAESLDVTSRIQWLGHHKNTLDFYRSSDVLVFPSEGVEPFGRVLIEAMACGIPVIGPRNGGVPEILTGEFQKFLFETGNTEDLIRSLISLMDWRKTDPELSVRCREHVTKHFSLDSAVNGVEDVFKRICL